MKQYKRSVPSAQNAILLSNYQFCNATTPRTSIPNSRMEACGRGIRCLWRRGILLLRVAAADLSRILVARDDWSQDASMPVGFGLSQVLEAPGRCTSEIFVMMNLATGG